MLRPSDAGTPAPPARSAPSRAGPLAAFALFAAALGAGGLLAWRAAGRDQRERRALEAASVVALKAEQVVRWREERFSDAQALAHDPELAAPLDAGSGSAARRSESLRAWFEAVRTIGDYVAVALLDREGRVVFAVGPLDRSPAGVRSLVERAAAERRPAMSDVSGPAGAPHLDVVAAVRSAGGSPIAAARSPGGTPIAAVLLRVDPRPYLFRVVEAWHGASPGADVLILRPEGGGAAPLNSSRLVPGASRFPFGGAIAGAVAARRAERFDAVDHRGVAVVGATVPVPGSPWVVLAKEDLRDVLAPLRERALFFGVGALGLLVAAGTLAAYQARRQADRFARARAAAEAERAGLARRLARLTAHAQDMVLLADERQRIVEANDRAVELLGYPREELVGMDVRALRDPATLGDYEERVREQRRHGTSLFETRYRRRDGSTFPVAVSVHVDDSDGRRWFEAIARDISDRKRAEEALRESEAKFRAAFEFASLGVVLVGADGRIVETNRALRDITGYSEGELRGAPIALLHDPAGAETTPSALLAGLARGERDRLEEPRRLRRKDGSLADTVVRASPLRDEAGEVRFLIAVVEDVSERKRLEAQLLLADRMASVGTLAAGVAHEINNPLAFILSNLDFALDELRRAGADPEVLRALADAKDGGARVREIVRDLRTFSRPVDEVREALDLRAVLQSAVGLASNEIRHRAQLVVEPGDAPRVAASEHRLGQVLLNLLINAAQAIPEGRAAGNVVRAATSTAPDGRAVVEISDTGAGIPPEVLPRIFDPFFSTKPVGVGTGLGLSICHGIVTQLGGEIAVETSPGRGSTFRVLLPPASAAPRAPASPSDAAPAAAPKTAPASPSDAAAAGAPATAPPPPDRPARILVVDDEPLVGRAVSRILGGRHEVVCRTSAREALSDLLGSAGYDLLLCDLMMPEMTGMDLHARLAREAPALAARTVFLTGGAYTPSARDFLDRVPNLRLEKPFDPQVLRDLVARALAAPPAAAARR